MKGFFMRISRIYSFIGFYYIPFISFFRSFFLDFHTPFYLSKLVRDKLKQIKKPLNSQNSIARDARESFFLRKKRSRYKILKDTFRKKYLDTDTFKILSEKSIQIQILIRYSQKKVSRYRYKIQYLVSRYCILYLDTCTGLIS